MNIFKILLSARNPEDEKMVTAPVEALVNTASEFTWLPGGMLSQIGVTPRKRQFVYTRTKQKVQRYTGRVILCANGRKAEEEVVFAESRDEIVIGVTAMEGLGIQIDDPGHGFIALTTLMSFQAHENLQAA